MAKRKKKVTAEEAPEAKTDGTWHGPAVAQGEIIEHEGAAYARVLRDIDRVDGLGNEDFAFVDGQPRPRYRGIDPVVLAFVEDRLAGFTREEAHARPGMGAAQARLDAVGEEMICEWIISGMRYREIAQRVGCGVSSIHTWSQANEVRRNRVKAALAMSGEGLIDAAEEILRDKEIAITRGKEIAALYVRRAAARAPHVWGQKVEVSQGPNFDRMSEEQAMQEANRAAAELGMAPPFPEALPPATIDHVPATSVDDS